MAVTVAAPSPFLTDWSASAAVVQLIVTNTDTSDVQASVRARFLLGDATVGTAGSPIMLVPGSHTPVPVPKVSVYSGAQVANWTQMQITGPIASAYRRTGRLPEGSYQLCMEFTNVTTQGRPLPDAGACTQFLVTYPQPPMLIAPADEQSVVTAYPTFQWTPVVMPAGRQASYLLRVVELLPGQTPLKALEADVPMFETVVNTITTLTYPPTALPLEAGKTYAWRVQAVNPANGDIAAGRVGVTTGLGANDGRSEVFTFTKKVLVTGAHIAVPSPPPSGPQQTPGYVTQTPMSNASLRGSLAYTFLSTQVPAPKRIEPYTGNRGRSAIRPTARRTRTRRRAGPSALTCRPRANTRCRVFPHAGRWPVCCYDSSFATAAARRR